MKSRVLCTIMTGLMVMSLAACGSKQTGATNTNSQAAVDYSEYAKLGDYKSIKVDVDKSAYEVTDEAIKTEIDNCLKQYAQVKEIREGVTKDNDTINLDYSGILDGVAFANGTATDTSYTIGGNFIEDLDRGLIGLEIGKEYDIPCTFPATYGNAELAGKDVIFKVTVNYVEEQILPEYNDDFVVMMTAESDEKMSTTKELEASIEEYLTETNKQAYETAVYGEYMKAILDATEFTGIPEAELENTKAMIKANAEYEYELYGKTYGIETFEEYMTGVYGYASIDDFNAEVDEFANEYMYEKMVLTLIAKEEGIEITDEQVKTYGEELATQSSYASLDELLKEYGDTLMDDIRYELLYNAVKESIIGNVTK